MAQFDALRKTLFCLLILCLGWGGIAGATELSVNTDKLTEEAIALQRDLLAIEQKLEAHLGEDRVVVYLDLGNVPKFQLKSLVVSIDNRIVATQTIDDQRRKALKEGGIQKLFVGALAPGQHSIHAQMVGEFEGAYSHEKTYPFEQQAGVNAIRVSIIDVMHQKGSEMVFYPEFAFGLE